MQASAYERLVYESSSLCDSRTSTRGAALGPKRMLNDRGTLIEKEGRETADGDKQETINRGLRRSNTFSSHSR